MNYLKVDKKIFLSPLRLTDIDQLVKYLNDEYIYNNTLQIPFPYTKEDGKFFISLCKEKKKKYGKNTTWAIRDKNKKLIGGCSFHVKYRRNSKKDEIGYWLARPYWNKGIMTKVVNKLCEIGFKKLGLTRIEATVFSHNDASCRVLGKAGFKFGGVFRKSIKKGNKLIDTKLFFKEGNFKTESKK
jgi:ribosomal-protein-alanine N-acetyltransferase